MALSWVVDIRVNASLKTVGIVGWFSQIFADSSGDVDILTDGIGQVSLLNDTGLRHCSGSFIH